MELFACLIIWLSILSLSLATDTVESDSRLEDEFIIRGPPFSPSTEAYIEGETLDKTITALTKRRMNDTLIIDAITGDKLGWNEFIKKSHRLAAKLLELGCSTGCITGIVSENRVEYPIVYLGTWLSGATLNNFDILSSNVELIRLYEITKPSIIFGPSKHCDRLREACSHCTFIVFDSESALDALQFSDIMRNPKETFEPVQINPDDTAFIMYSSGTTGLPKAIQLSHKGLVYLTKLFYEKKMPKKENGVMVSDRGFCHGMGLVIFLVTVVRNQTLVIMPKAEEENHDDELFLKIIEEYGVNMILTVPATIIFMLKDERAQKYKLPSLEYIVSSASPLRPEIEEEIKEKLKENLKGVIQWYGSTESMLNTTKDVDNPKSGTVGSVNPLIEMKVVDLETKKSLGPLKHGEIWIRGPTITKGYYGNPEVTALAIDKDGWYHSGDIGYYDTDKDFFIVGRLKEVIRYKSYPVVPAEIEGLLLSHPAVLDCAAIGIPDELFTELPGAYVVKKPDEKYKETTENELVNFVQEKASPYAHLRAGVKFISKIPKTTTGKILRSALQDMWKEEQAAELEAARANIVETTALGGENTSGETSHKSLENTGKEKQDAKLRSGGVTESEIPGSRNKRKMIYTV